MQSHRTLHNHNIPATRPYAGKVGRPVGTVINKEDTVIILDNIDFFWTVKDIDKFKELWLWGKPGPEIAKFFNRDEDEIRLLEIDQRRKKKVKERKGGWFGEMSYMPQV